MRKKARETVCVADVLHAIRNAYPDGTVTDDVLYSGEDSYYDEIREKVRSALRAIKGADLVYDRPPEGTPHWNECSDPGEDPPDWEELASSYDLFFFALRDKQFEFEGELEEDDMPDDADGPVLVTVPTVGRIGCAVGISVIAPFAAISHSDMEFAESGSGSFPDIRVGTCDGDEAMDEEELADPHVRAEIACWEKGKGMLQALQEEIARVLDAFDIRVLPAQELQARIPGLKPDPARSYGPVKTATVGEALFFVTFG